MPMPFIFSLSASLLLTQVFAHTLARCRYAKYLDCGGDMFTEAIVMNWLSNGSRPNGE
jgi:hypothetical protein